MNNSTGDGNGAGVRGANAVEGREEGVGFKCGGLQQWDNNFVDIMMSSSLPPQA